MGCSSSCIVDADLALPARRGHGRGPVSVRLRPRAWPSPWGRWFAFIGGCFEQVATLGQEVQKKSTISRGNVAPCWAPASLTRDRPRRMPVRHQSRHQRSPCSCRSFVALLRRLVPYLFVRPPWVASGNCGVAHPVRALPRPLPLKPAAGPTPRTRRLACCSRPSSILVDVVRSGLGLRMRSSGAATLGGRPAGRRRGHAAGRCRREGNADADHSALAAARHVRRSR